MSDNTADLITQINKAFDEYKSANDQRLAQIESKGSADPLLEAKCDRINDAITQLQTEFADFQKKAGRPAAGETTDAAQAEYRSAFNAYLRKGRNEAELEAKAVNTATGADGGFALPEVIDSAISQKLIEISPMRQIANVVSISTSDYKHLVNAKGIGSGWVGEAAARPETGTPALVEVAIAMGELYANPAATQAALDDLVFDVEAMLSADTAEEFARQEGAAFVSGNGTNKPSGFLNNTPTTSGSDTVLQYVAGGHASLLNDADKLISLFYSLKAGYRANGTWAMNSATQAAIRSLKGTDGHYLWAPGLSGGPATILGRPVVEMADMPAIAANAFPVAFGDFRSGYLIADRMGVRTVRDPFSNKPYVHFYSTRRVGGKLVLPEAIKVLKIAAA